MHKIERRECLILAFPVQRRLIAELPVWHNVHMRFSSHAKVRRENEQVPAHQNRRSTRNTPTIWLRFANPADAERIKEGFEKAGLSHQVQGAVYVQLNGHAASSNSLNTRACLLLAQSGHSNALNQCLLLGVKRT